MHVSKVIIVGGGPVGLALACTLAQHGVRSLVLEARAECTPRDESRAIVIMPRGLEFLEWLGVRQTFESAGLRRTSHAFVRGGTSLLTMDFTHVHSPYRYSLQLPQHDTEQFLEQLALRSGLVEVRRGHRVLQAWQADGSAWCRVAAGESTYTLDAAWAVACDGTKSQVRSALGLDGTWADYGADSAVADFEMDCGLPSDRSFIDLDPARPVGMFCFARDRWRLTYRLNPGEDRHAMTLPAAATRLLKQVSPDAVVRRFLWASAFRLGQGQASHYRAGPWILAGDAAHAMGPSAGAGMMLGLLGAFRLGWRLALASRGHAHAGAMLEDYAREQRVAAQEVQAANRLVFKNIAVQSHAIGWLRAIALRLAVAHLPRLLPDWFTDSEALVNQVLPVRGAFDADALQGRSVTTCGAWRLGKRAPALPEVLSVSSCSHTLFSIGQQDDEELGRRTMRTLSASRALPVEARRAPPAAQIDAPIGFALVRPDQHVVALTHS